MKFLLSHSDKLFLVVVLGLSSWSLVGSVQSFRRATVLPPEAKRLFEEIQKAFDKRRDIKPPELNYASHLKAALKAGASKTGPRLPPWMWNERPREGGPEYVLGVLGVPRDVKVKAGRQGVGVTVSWSEPTAAYVNVVAYEVFKWLAGENPPEKPTFELNGTSVVDDKTEAEETYSYKVRATGVPAPEKDNQIVERPKGVTQMGGDGEKRFVTAFSAEASATIPSNIEFEFLGSYEQWDKPYARINIKVWNTEKGDWDVYRTDPGIKQGERIKGYRTEGFRRKEYDSGYMFEKVGEETHTIQGPTRKVFNPQTGKFEEQETRIEKKVQFITVRKDGLDVTRKVYKKSDLSILEKCLCCAGKRTPSGRTQIKRTRRRPKPQREKKTGEIDFGALRAQMTGAGEKKPAATGAPAAAAPRRVSGGMVSYEADHQTIFFDVPASWTPAPGAFDYGDDANTTLMEGFIVAYTGPGEDLKMIVQQIYEEEGPFGAGTEKVVRTCTEAWKRQTLAAFPAAELKDDTAVMVGMGGRLFAYFTATTKVGNRHLTVARYCGYTSKNRHMATFVCRTEDYEALSKTFLRIVGTLNW